MLVASYTQSQGDPVWESLLVLESAAGGVDLLLVFLAFRFGRERLLKSDIPDFYVFLA